MSDGDDSDGAQLQARMTALHAQLDATADRLAAVRRRLAHIATEMERLDQQLAVRVTWVSRRRGPCKQST
jgi:ribosomal protein L29